MLTLRADVLEKGFFFDWDTIKRQPDRLPSFTCNPKKMNLSKILRDLGCPNVKSNGIMPVNKLRDRAWVQILQERGYDHGEAVYPDGTVTEFFLTLPDGCIASAQNFMLGNGFHAVAEELAIDADAILGQEPYGEVITSEDDEECAVIIWTEEEFIQKINQIKNSIL